MRHAANGLTRTLSTALACLLAALALWPAPAQAIHRPSPKQDHVPAYQQGYDAGESNCQFPEKGNFPNLANAALEFAIGWNDGCRAGQKKKAYNDGYRDGQMACRDKDTLQTPTSGTGSPHYVDGFLNGCRSVLKQGGQGPQPDDRRENPHFPPRAQPLAVTALEARQGPAAGGTRVTIKGTGFTDITAVRFGAVPAQFTVTSSREITAIAPPGPVGSTVPITVARETRVRQVTGSDGNGMAVKSDGSVWLWGDASVGRGDSIPVQVPGLAGVTALAASDYGRPVALLSDGTVRVWGTDRKPEPVRGLPAAVAIVSAHALAADGSVWSWSEDLQAAAVPNLSQVQAIAAGRFTTYALRTDGTVWAWGANSNGALGAGAGQGSHAAVPVQVRGLSDIIAIAAGLECGYALRSDGTVWAWGYNGQGQLGDGSTGSSPVPVQVRGLPRVKAVAAGSLSAFALTADGRVWGWGSNALEWLARVETDRERYNPVTLPRELPLGDVVAIGPGWSAVYALTADGSVQAWGKNDDGQFGDGTVYFKGHWFVIDGVSATPVEMGWEIVGSNVARRADGTLFDWNQWTRGPANPVRVHAIAPAAVTSADPELFTYAGLDCSDPGLAADVKRRGGCPGFEGEKGGPADEFCESPLVTDLAKRQAGCPGYGPAPEPQPEPEPVKPEPVKPEPVQPIRDGVNCDSDYVPAYMKRQVGCPGYGPPPEPPPPWSQPDPTPAPTPEPKPAPQPTPGPQPQPGPYPDPQPGPVGPEPVPPPLTGVECAAGNVPTYVKRQAGCPGYGLAPAPPPAPQPPPVPPQPQPAPVPGPAPVPVPDPLPAPVPVPPRIDGVNCSSALVPTYVKRQAGCQGSVPQELLTVSLKGGDSFSARGR